MIAFLADENFNGRIINGLARRMPDIDIALAQDVGLFGIKDPLVLEWAALHNRILLTHDVQTITRFAYERVHAGLPMPGVIEVHSTFPIGAAIEELLLIAQCSEPGDWSDRVVYVPL